MLLVLCLALILNSILISNQVDYKSKVKNSPLTTHKRAYTPLNQKLRNVRKLLRKSRRNLKVGVDDLGYEDISDLLQYNYKDIWWTNTVPSTTQKPTTLSTINIYHRTDPSVTEITINYPTKISTVKIIPKVFTKTSDLPHSTSVKLEEGKPELETNNAVNLAPESNVRSNKVTTPVKLVTEFVDKNKGIFLPVFSRNKDGDFSILGNGSSIQVKRNENDSNAHASITDNLFIPEELAKGEFDYIELGVNKNNTKDYKFIKVTRFENVGEELKKLPLGSNFLVNPTESVVLPSVKKDGIYRIELPKPVTRTTTADPQSKAFEPKVYLPNHLQPKQQLLDDALAYYNINSSQTNMGTGSNYGLNNLGRIGPGPYNSQIPPNYRQNPIYKPNNFGQYRPYYNPQNSGNFAQRPFYGQSNFGQYGTRNYPYNNPQYSNNFKVRPFSSNKFAQQGPGRYYPQNYRNSYQGANNFGQGFTPPNPGNYGRSPFYNPQNANNAQNLYNNIQGPISSNGSDNPDMALGTTDAEATEKDDKEEETTPESTLETTPETTPVTMPETLPETTPETMPETLPETTPGTLPKTMPETLPESATLFDNLIPKDVLDKLPPAALDYIAMELKADKLKAETEEPPYKEPVTLREKTTPYLNEDGSTPRGRTAPPFVDEIGPISDYVKNVLADMNQLGTGYFSIFCIRLFAITATKQHEALSKFLQQAEAEVNIMYQKEPYIQDFGEPFSKSFRELANYLGAVSVDVVQSVATMLHHTMINRKVGVTKDINSVIDYIDSLYDQKEGIELLRVLEDIKNYDNAPMDRYQLYRKMSAAVFAPVRRLSGTNQKQVLIEALNKVIDNHSKQISSGLSIARRQIVHPKNNVKSFASVSPRFNNINRNNRNNNKRIRQLRTTKQQIPNKFGSTRFSNNFNEHGNYNNRFKVLAKQRPREEEKRIQNGRTFTKFMNNVPFKPISTKQAPYNLRPDTITTTYYILPLSPTTVGNIMRHDAVLQSVNEKSKYLRNRIEATKDIIPENILREGATGYVKRVTPIGLDNTNKKSVQGGEYPDLKYEDHGFEDTTRSVQPTVEQSPASLVTTTTATVTTTVSSEDKPKSTEEHHDQKVTYKHREPDHNYEEIRHLRLRHPKIYKKYMAHMKKVKRKKKHKKRIHGKKKRHHSKKKSRHSGKKNIPLEKKVSKKIKDLRKMELYLKHILKHHIERKNLKASPSAVTEKHIKKSKFSPIDDNESRNIYTPHRSAELKKIDPTHFIIKQRTTTPNFAYNTPPMNPIIPKNPTARSDEAWFQSPQYETMLDGFAMNYRVRQEPVINEPESSENSLEVFKPNSKSYSDEEEILKYNLDDAMRHNDLRVLPNRRKFDSIKKENKLRTLSSYSSEEIVLKSNIYKAVGFNSNRANFSEIVGKGSHEKGEKISFRRRFRPVNEMTSYSDEEKILKRNLYA